MGNNRLFSEARDVGEVPPQMPQAPEASPRLRQQRELGWVEYAAAARAGEAR